MPELSMKKTNSSTFVTATPLGLVRPL